MKVLHSCIIISAQAAQIGAGFSQRVLVTFLDTLQGENATGRLCLECVLGITHAHSEVQALHFIQFTLQA